MLTHVRSAARTGPNGQTLPPSRQDRSPWNQAELAEGRQLLDRAFPAERLSALEGRWLLEHPLPSAVDLRMPNERHNTRRRRMFNSKPLLASAALAALVAAPAFALDLSSDITIGAAPEDMTTVSMMSDSAFVGNEVRTKDQIVIGQVDNVYEADGGPVAVVTLNSDFGAKSSVKSFTVPLASDITADGSLTLGWTEAELIAAISSNIDPTAPAQNDSDDDDKSDDDKSDDAAEGSGG
ncbi:MAG: hypothetical protein Q8M85_04410 [Tabrizicola sp.]|nr:DUF6596 domain-containing protein [Tabrizicola sp.]MDP3194490.1 hypothetical protein [Tabrizicola sp.]